MFRPYFHGQRQQEDKWTIINLLHTSSLGVAQDQATTLFADLSNQFLHLIDQSESKKQLVCPFTVASIFYAKYFLGDSIGYLLLVNPITYGRRGS
jgi:hypothetical protein